jgi:hypothetical protein
MEMVSFMQSDFIHLLIGETQGLLSLGINMEEEKTNHSTLFQVCTLCQILVKLTQISKHSPNYQ